MNSTTWRCVGDSSQTLTSRFIESRTQESFDNQTASDIAALLAARRGLIPIVTPTAIVVGRSYQNDHSQTTLDQHTRYTTEWDLLVQLADAVGYDVWVDGQILHFAPPDQAANQLQLGPSDCISMRFNRILALTNGIDVSVKSWDCRGQKAVVQTASSATGSAGRRGYVLVRPNLAEDAAQTVAQRLLTQMCQHGRSVSIEMPGDVSTRPRDILSIVGSGTDFDGVWTISEVTRRISFDQGFTQTLEARIPAWTAF